MHTDPYLFFTDCHRIYIKGVRRAIKDRLEAVFEKDWWEWGVDLALSEDQKTYLREHITRERNREPYLFLDPSHFIAIITKNHNQAFSDAFTNIRKTSNDLRILVALRNDWAHTQEMPWGRAIQGADLMRHILVSLNCAEAVEVDRMLRESAHDAGNDPAKEEIGVLEHPDGGLEHEAPLSEAPSFWHQMQSYLQYRTHVEDLGSSDDGRVKVIVTVFNSAPDSLDYPYVQFRSVTITSSVPLDGGRRHEMSLEQMDPGDIRHVEFELPKHGLLSAEFEIKADLDAEKLFHFRRIGSFPDDILAPIQARFVERLKAVGVREFVSEVLESIGEPDAKMTLADMTRIRESIGRQPARITAKQEAIGQIIADFHMSRSSLLRERVRDIARTLDAFGRQLDSLDVAIGKTDLERMNQAIEDLKGIELALIRVEDVVRDKGLQSSVQTWTNRG